MRSSQTTVHLGEHVLPPPQQGKKGLDGPQGPDGQVGPQGPEGPKVSYTLFTYTAKDVRLEIACSHVFGVQASVYLCMNEQVAVLLAISAVITLIQIWRLYDLTGGIVCFHSCLVLFLFYVGATRTKGTTWSSCTLLSLTTYHSDSALIALYNSASK